MALAWGCGSGDTPSDPDPTPEPPILSLVAGHDASDTLGTVLPEDLVVRVTRGSVPLADGTIRFHALDSNSRLASTTQLTGFENIIFEPTDVQGLARVTVKLMHAGTAEIAVTLEDVEGVADTVRYEVQPGRPYRRLLQPRDPGMLVGDTVDFEVSVVDREFNPLPEEGTIQIVSGPVEAHEADRISGEDLGTGVLTSEGPGVLADTTRVFVLPVGELAYSVRDDSATLNVARLDGGDDRLVARTVTSHTVTIPPAPIWHPDGDRILYLDGFGPRTLYVASLSGSFSPHELHSHEGEDIHSPDVSADGEWVYYGGQQRIWRVRIDGTDPEPIGEPSGGTIETHPSPSPDGTRVVLQNGLRELRMKDVATGVADPAFQLPGLWPRWSPDGEWIAFVDTDERATPGRIFVIRPDGTGQREVAVSEEGWEGPISWSSDGIWLLLEQRFREQNSTHGRSAVVDVASGLTIELPDPPGAAEDRAWRP